MSVAELKQQLLEERDRADYWESVVQAFFTGDVPKHATINHVILAKHGRMRLDSLKKTPALLQGDVK
jgi:hypothetical protein